MEANNCSNDAQHKTVHVDTVLLEDALIGQWREDEGNCHVMTVDESDYGYVLSYDVRDRVDVRSDDDYVPVSDAFGYYDIVEPGQIREYDLADSIDVGGETYYLD